MDTGRGECIRGMTGLVFCSVALLHVTAQGPAAIPVSDVAAQLLLAELGLSVGRRHDAVVIHQGEVFDGTFEHPIRRFDVQGDLAKGSEPDGTDAVTVPDRQMGTGFESSACAGAVALLPGNS